MGVTILPVRFVFRGREGATVLLAEHEGELYGFEVREDLSEDLTESGEQFVWVSVGATARDKRVRKDMRYIKMWG